MSYTRAAVASLAGVGDAFVDRLCDLGILTATGGDLTEGDVRRARILHSLEVAGLPLEAVGEGVRRGVVDLAFVDDPAYELFTGLELERFRRWSSRASTDEVVAASDLAGVEFEAIGPVDLKGLTEPIPLSVARRSA